MRLRPGRLPIAPDVALVQPELAATDRVSDLLTEAVHAALAARSLGGHACFEANWTTRIYWISIIFYTGSQRCTDVIRLTCGRVYKSAQDWNITVSG